MTIDFKEKKENLNRNTQSVAEELDKIDIEAVTRGVAMAINNSNEIAGVNHTFTKENDIKEAIKHNELVDELKKKIDSNSENELDNDF